MRRQDDTGVVDTMALARDERTDLLAYLETLTPEQWESPSLCAEWRVRDVVAHLISFDVLSIPQTIGRFARGIGRRGGPNQVGVDAARDLTTDQLLDQIRAHLTPRGLTADLSPVSRTPMLGR